MTPVSGVSAPPPEPAWRPLSSTEFRKVWTALLGSQILNWAHTVGAVSVIAALSGSATLLALVQTAVSLPAVLLALVAGAAADIIDRRRLVLWIQSAMVVILLVLAALTAADVVTSAVVLALTFALGAGTATTVLAYQAATQDVIAPGQLSSAVALNGVAINLARSVGPALAGLLVALLGADALFVIEAAFLMFIMTVVYRLRLPAVDRSRAEDMWPAMRAGVRYVRYSRSLRAVLARAVLFSLCASAMWALLPVVAFGRLGLESGGFGVLLGCIGVGAISGAFFMPRVRARFRLDVLVPVATLVHASGLAVLALVDVPVLVGLVLLPMGAAWLTILAALNTSAQRVAPGWVRARALAAFQMVFQGGLALGALIWGVVASATDSRVALLVAVGGLLVGVVAGFRWPLARAEAPDMSPAEGWAEPELAIEPDPSDGPVLITLEYDVADDDAEAFVAAMRELGRSRRRGGAYMWNLYEDLSVPGRYLETFRVRSWAEHLLQSERVTVADAEVQARARAFHVGEDPPRVRHLRSALTRPAPDAGAGSAEVER